MTSFRSASSNSGASGTAPSVSAPAGTTTGDRVYLLVHANGVVNITDNNGSTPFTAAFADYQESSSGLTARLFYRTIQAGDPSTYNFTVSGAGGRWGVIATSWSSPHASVIFEVASSNAQQGAGTTIGTNSITTLFANAIHCIVAGADGAANAFAGAPGGYTLRSNLTTDQTLVFSSQVFASPGATGGATYTYTNSDGAFSLSFALQDHLSGTGSTYNESVTEAASSSDARAATLTALNTLTDAASSSESLAHTAILGNGLTEAGTALDTGINTAIIVAGTNENGAASDALADSVGNSTYNEALTEPATAADIYSVDAPTLQILGGLRIVLNPLQRRQREARAVLDAAEAIEQQQPAIAPKVASAKRKVQSLVRDDGVRAERLESAIKVLEQAIEHALIALLTRVRARR